MANLKNITDLPVAESAEGLNLIVNDNGAAKQIAADAICKVKSVNGAQPDENGNVEIDTASSWNDLKDKPFYIETDEDGNETIHKLDAKYLPDDVVGEQMDIVLTINAKCNSTFNESAVSITEGSMEAVRAAYVEGRVPKGKAIHVSGQGQTEYGVYGECCEFPLCFYLYGGYITVSWLATRAIDQRLYYIRAFFNEDGEIYAVTRFYSGFNLDE